MDRKRDLGRVIDYLKARYDIPHDIYDPCCGNMQIAARLKALGHNIIATDYKAGYGIDFLSTYSLPVNNILTFPPKINTEDYLLHALSILKPQGQCIMLIRTSFLEGQERYKKIFKYYPPYKILQFSERVDETRTAYAWYIWIKGLKTKTILEWV